MISTYTSKARCTDKKERKNFLILEEGNGCKVMTNGLLFILVLYMIEYLHISSYIWKPFFIYDFATNPIWISLYMRKNLFSFLSVWLSATSVCYSSRLPRNSRIGTFYNYYSFFIIKNYIFCLVFCILEAYQNHKCCSGFPALFHWRRNGGCPQRLRRCLRRKAHAMSLKSFSWLFRRFSSVKKLCGRCLSKYIDWRYIQSCWYLQPSFVTCCPSNLLSGSIPPFPLPCVNNFTRIQCVRGGGGVWNSVGDHILQEFNTLYLYLLNTCRKVPLQVNFFRWGQFALFSSSLISLWINDNIPCCLRVRQ